MSRATALLLVRHATTVETRAGRFPTTSGAAEAPGCAVLDRAGRAQVRALRGRLPTPDRVWSSHARRARETAELLGLPADEVLGQLAELGFGRWAGLDPSEVHRLEPGPLAAWYADPGSAPHGGETLADLRARAAAVLARAAALGGTTLAVTHGGTCKAALLEALGVDGPGLVWQLDIAPASVTELHHSAGRWRLVRSNWRPSPEGWPRRPAGAGAAPARVPAGGLEVTS